MPVVQFAGTGLNYISPNKAIWDLDVQGLFVAKRVFFWGSSKEIASNTNLRICNMDSNGTFESYVCVSYSVSYHVFHYWNIHSSLGYRTNSEQIHIKSINIKSKDVTEYTQIYKDIPRSTIQTNQHKAPNIQISNRRMHVQQIYVPRYCMSSCARRTTYIVYNVHVRNRWILKNVYV